MLRITSEIGDRTVTLRLEGRLAGPGLQALEECWQKSRALPRQLARYVDLTGVTFIDSAGTACLATMYRQGAEFIATDCMTKEIVAEITRSSLADGSQIAPTIEPRRNPYARSCE
jgi:ABC-type transporter Mla MlaB component